MSSGTITLRRPRVRGVEERFESRVLLLFARRTKELGALLPELYLHGLAERDFELAMRGLLGEGAPLSKSSIRRLGAGWTREFEEWSQRRLEGREVVYVWADGIYVKAGLERDKAALLVVLGAMRDGTKEVLALRSGCRESVESWSEVLRDLKARGIEAPRLLMADGNTAIWGAVRQVWPEAGEQRCWNHKMRNVLDRLPQREQSEAKDLLRAVVYAPSRAEALKAREVFARRYRPWYPKAVDVLEDDWERMVAFYDFPEDHWKHLRTTNVVESPFAESPSQPNSGRMPPDGLDVVGVYNALWGDGNSTDISLAYNYNETTVLTQRQVGGVDPVSDDLIFNIENNLAKHRATLSVTEGFGEQFSATLRGNYYSGTIDERGEQEVVGAEVLIDAELSYQIDENFSVVGRANNLFNNFPDEIATRLSQGMPYPRRSPISYHGGMTYLRVVYSF